MHRLSRWSANAVGAVLAAALGPALAFPAPGAAGTDQTAALRFTFIGNMAVHVTDGDTVLVTDFPYESGAFGYMKWSAEAVPPVKDGLVLVTHSHRDHFAAGRLAGYDVTVAGPADVLRLAKGKPTLALSGPARFRGVEIEPRPTPHASLEHLSYLVTWHGLRLYFTGDTEDPADLLAMRNLDVAFVSPWLLASARKKGRVDARQVVVYHHSDGQAVPGSETERKVPRQGEQWSVSGRAPESPVVFVCEHGSAKSLVAAQWFNRLARERGLPYRAVSRGVAPDPALPGHVVENLRRDGFDVSGMAPVGLGGEDLAGAKRVVAIGAQDPRFGTLARPPERWDDIPPASTDFAASREAMRKRIDLLLDELVREP
jgi:protein-tyrosine-phosphatase